MLHRISSSLALRFANSINCNYRNGNQLKLMMSCIAAKPLELEVVIYEDYDNTGYKLHRLGEEDFDPAQRARFCGSGGGG